MFAIDRQGLFLEFEQTSGNARTVKHLVIQYLLQKLVTKNKEMACSAEQFGVWFIHILISKVRAH